jgi:dihydroorotate dehydrogenase electron transfer subunit
MRAKIQKIFAEVLLNQKETENVYLMELKATKDFVSLFKPGQFLKVKVNNFLDPLFPRPFTVHLAEEDRIFILYQVVGKGTKELSNIQNGEKLLVWGPLGNPFPKLENYLICAGGVGIAGFGFLLKEASCKNNYILPKKILYGARTKNQLARLSFFKNFKIPIEIATEDGSIGYKGVITDLLEKELKEKKFNVIACGPPLMLKKIAELGEKYQVKTYLVMETFLACGLGFCRGCVIPLKTGGYKHLCIDGPTFKAEEVLFET